MFCVRVISMFILPLMVMALPCHAELQELNDSQLALLRGQAVIDNNVQDQVALLNMQSGSESSLNAASSLTTNQNFNQNHSAGITMDIYLDMHISEIRWVDADGAGPNGTQGSVSLSNFSMGGGSVSSPSAAEIKGITLDVSGSNSITLGVQKIGGPL